MDWSNRFTLGEFTVTYFTFLMAWEVVEKLGGYEVGFRCFYSTPIFALVLTVTKYKNLAVGGAI